MAGITNKREGFWKEVRRWDVVVMSETWLDEKRWEKARDFFPRGFRWEVQWAKRRSKKGRAMGGMAVGIKGGIEIRKVEARKEEGIVEVEVEMNKEIWRIVGVYINGDMDRKIESLKEWMEEGDGVRTLVGGDFNARVGEEGGGIEEQNWEEGGGGRKSKDKRRNKEGRVLVRGIEEAGWSIFNGNVEGDREGEWTFTGGRGETVIDFIIGSMETKEIVEGMEVEDCVESDHHPVVVWMRRRKKEQRKKEGIRRAGRWEWSEKGREEFREALGGITMGEGEVGRICEKVRRQIIEILKRGRKERGVAIRKSWWDEECEGKKRAVRKALRRWRRGEGCRQRYKEEKLEYKKLVERKKKEENEKWERELRKIKTEGQVWEMVGKTRKRRRVNERIKMEEWDKYFRELLGGVCGRVRRGMEEGKGGRSGRGVKAGGGEASAGRDEG